MLDPAGGEGSDVTVRPFRAGDGPAVRAIFAELKRVPDDVAARTVAEVQRSATYHLVAERAGSVVGRAAVVRLPSLPGGTLAVGVGVAGAARRRGVGAALWDALVAELPDATHRLLAFSDDRDDAEALPYARARGFVQFQHSVTSARDLTSVPEPDAPPAGLSVELLDPGETRQDTAVEALYAASDTSPEAGEFGVRTWAEEVATTDGMGDRGLLVLVRSGDRPVALSLAADEGEGVWHVLYTGVLPAARGQGLARLAKEHLHGAAAALGGRRVVSDNEAGNEGIRRVNDQLGYAAVEGTRRFARDLAADPLS